MCFFFLFWQIALTTFESLCGFRSLAEIKKYIETIPELALVIGKEAEDAIASGPGLFL